MKKKIARKFDLIVVLGMHRSGTSAITRGLEVLGVELGDNLMSPMANNNSKGFFEDLDVVDLNISLLNHLGLDWHYASPVTDSQVDDLIASGYLLRAADLMRRKIAFKRPYGIKDPRLAKLIPFWKKVFKHCELDVGYVIAVRNPISVAKSLKKRDGFAFEKSYLFWLDHVLSALIHTEGVDRIVVDFDLVMDHPTKQLDRLAKAFNLSVNSDAMTAYIREFLDEELRHNIDQTRDLAIDPRIPEMARDLYPMLRAGAEMDKQFRLSNDQIAYFTNGRKHLHAAILYIDQLNQAVADRDGQLATLNQAVAERDGQIVTLNQSLADRDGQLAKLNQLVADRDEQLASLHQAIKKREERLSLLEKSIFKLSQNVQDMKLVIESAKRWQKRSWVKRVFHRWRAPSDTWQKVHWLKKMERSFRKRRDMLMTSIFQREQDSSRIDNESAELAVTSNDEKSGFSIADVERIPTEAFSSKESPVTDIRAIALYLPQFHVIPENDQWWGEGFTEWTNVRRATPQYAGHYQPHIPHPDFGYYDLNDASVLEKQTAIARAAGIEGFCFYYYWFNGRQLLNMPTDRLLATGKPDFPFCFCWANENWTRTWDGYDNEILIGQEHSDESDERFILDLLPAFRDPRYIRVEGKPLLIVYRPGLLPNPAATARHWRETCRREGIGEIFLARMQMFDWELEGRDPGFDTVIQFPPVSRKFSPSLKTSIQIHDPKSFVGEIYDYHASAENYPLENIGKNLWPGVCPSWDNTARRMELGYSWANSSPEVYHKWLSKVLVRARQALPPQQRFVFINAWNEWAEGCHLEPDEKYGYAWLNATRLAITNAVPPAPQQPRRRLLVVGHDACRAGAQIVLLALLREWKQRQDVECRLILLGDGVLRPEFENACHTLVLSDHVDEASRNQALANYFEPAPDVILANTVVIGPFLKELKSTGAAIVTYVHELQKSIERWAPGEIMAATVADSDHFIAVSSPVADNLVRNHGIATSAISLVHEYIKTRHFVSFSRLEELRAELGLQLGDKVVFGCGTLDWRKGPDLFAEIARKVLADVPEARFVWIGADNNDEAGSRAKALADHSRISFIGERETPRDYLALGSAFLLSSREDPFPLVSLEAADAGLPTVCFAGAGGMPDFVGNSCGRTVPFEDVDAATRALTEILSNPSLRESLGHTARESVRAKHDAAKGSEAVLSILNLAAGAPPITPPSGQPLVSVIVPNYNHARFLPERLESIARQTLADFEIILLDDCSTDDSLDILREFADREPRARLILNSKNSGSTFKQWRKGLSESCGKYIWIAESDDSADPELLATLVGKLEANPAAVLATCCPQMTDICGKDLGTPRDWFSDIGAERWESDFSASGREMNADVLSQKNAILNASGVLFRSSVGTVDLVEDSMRLCADWLFWIRLMAYGDFEYTAHPLNYWRLASSNARTKTPGEVEWEEGCRVLREIAHVLGLDGPGEDRLIDQFRKRCDGWKAKHENESKPVKAATQAPGIFLQRDGWCPICENEAVFTAKYSWLRDHYLCSRCGSIPRERAIMHVIQTRYPNWRELRIHESSPGNRGTSVKLAKECKYYTASQYDPDMGFGNTYPSRGYRSENLEKQTFPDETFDIVVSQDVLEHIFDAEAAFKDIHRTLKPGGAHIFTTPLVNKEKPTQRRAELRSDGTINHLYPPEYHDNPMTSEGSLVTFHWGFDIAEIIEKTTSGQAEIIQPTDAEMGIEAKYIEVIVQKKKLIDSESINIENSKRIGKHPSATDCDNHNRKTYAVQSARKIKKIIIHIGSPKTGTSAVQLFLKHYCNEDRRFEVDYFLQLLDPTENQHSAIFIDISKRYNKILETILNSKSEIGIFSAEVLSFLMTDPTFNEKIRELISALESNAITVYVVGATRDPLSYLVSSYGEDVIGGRCPLTFQNWLFTDQGAGHRNVTQSMCMWKDIPGLKAFHWFLFDSESGANCIDSVINTCLDNKLKIQKINESRKSEMIRKSFDGSIIEAVRRINIQNIQNWNTYRADISAYHYVENAVKECKLPAHLHFKRRNAFQKYEIEDIKKPLEESYSLFKKINFKEGSNHEKYLISDEKIKQALSKIHYNEDLVSFYFEAWNGKI